jgi:carboxyl-terminal processing protease
MEHGTSALKLTTAS